MYVCMYVCMYPQVMLNSPTHISVSRGHWPPTVLQSTVGGTAIAWMSLPWLATRGGDMYAYVYIYIVCVLVGAFHCC